MFCRRIGIGSFVFLFTLVSVLSPMQSVFAASGGVLYVNSSPVEKGASIVIDGDIKGVVPGKIELPAGNYVVTIVGKKYSGQKTVSIANGETKRTTIALTYKTEQRKTGFFMKLFQFVLGAGIIWAMVKYVQDQEGAKETTAD